MNERREAVAHSIIGCAIEVHRGLGPGLLESAYEECLSYELTRSGLHFRRQVPVPLDYKAVHLDHGYRSDLLVEGLVIVEIKSVEALSPLHEAQLLTYLRLSGVSLGLLINFNVLRLKDGLRRFVI